MIHQLNTILITILRIPLVLIAPITTFFSGLLAAVTFGIFGILSHWTKNLFFILPTLMFSKFFESGNIIGKVLSLLGLPFSICGDIVSGLIGHGGDFGRRVYEMLLYESFPYSYSFDKYAKNKVELYDLDDKTQEVINDLLETHYKLLSNLQSFRNQFEG